MFTARLIEALVRSERLALKFAYRGKQIPAKWVQTALRQNCGACVHDALAQEPQRYNKKIDRHAPLLFPSAKSHHGHADREASTIHDLSTLFMPETHEDANVAHHIDTLHEELKSNEVVFCVSEATRAALITAFPSAAPKIRVLYQYVEWPEEFETMDRNLPAVRLGPYAVVVGTLEPRKNLQLLVRALANREIARSNFTFVIVGRKGWLIDELLSSLTPQHRERIVFTGFVSEFIKYRLIRHCEFMIYPSLYEGFGIPALEATSLGKPVLASRTSSFPEVIGAAGVYFDPLSVSEFVDAFKEIRSPRKAAELKRASLVEARKFDWRRMATPVLDWVDA